jgi:putative ATP-dependent endonuclease of OLD family
MISAMEATKAKFDDTEKAKTDYVEANWDSRKTQLVPGELVLDHVLRSFGLRFSKDHDGPRMASMMRDDEIDPAMKAFMRELGAN